MEWFTASSGDARNLRKTEHPGVANRAGRARGSGGALDDRAWRSAHLTLKPKRARIRLARYSLILPLATICGDCHDNRDHRAKSV